MIKLARKMCGNVLMLDVFRFHYPLIYVIYGTTAAQVSGKFIDGVVLTAIYINVLS